MEGVFFYDPARGEVLRYADLRTGLAAELCSHAPVAQPRSAGEAAGKLAEAVLLEQALTLFDIDFSAEERSALGATDDALAERRSVPGRPVGDMATLLVRAREGDGFRLTLFTSGSTGLPKRVTHRLEGLTRTLRVGERHRDAVWGLAYNPTHIAGVQVVLQALFNQNPLVYLFQREPAQVAAAIIDHQVSHLSATPSFYRLLLTTGFVFPRVRSVALGGERSDETLLKRLATMFPAARIRNLYASTEAGTLLVAEGECFRIPDGLSGRVRIHDGQIEVHRSLLGELAGAAAPASEWYRTGDVVEVVSAEPLLFRILSRERDWVNVGGHKVNPAEVEEALLAFPGMREARVYGRANSVLGHILCAEVVTAAELDEPALRAWLTERLQAAKIPRVIKRVPALTRSRTGKLARP